VLFHKEIGMGPFTFVLPWIVQDIIILAITLGLVIFIVRREKRPAPFLVELFCFVFLYAAVYENAATLHGLYGYGKSILMIFNVPLTVPLAEYIVVYAALRMSDTMKMPALAKPLFVGVIGMVYDLSLDPLSVSQVFAGVHETAIGRWSWFPQQTDPVIFGIPVFNFPGWVILCGYAALTLTLGRALYRRSGCKTWVGYVYPVVAMLVGLGIMMSPVSSFLLWLAPFMSRGSVSQWIMLGLYCAGQVAVYLIAWRGRMLSKLSFRDNWPAFYVLVGTHLVNIVFALAGGYYSIIWLQAVALAAGTAMIAPVILAEYRRTGEERGRSLQAR
jgi:hypothetical protein